MKIQDTLGPDNRKSKAAAWAGRQGQSFAALLLDWFDREARSLPWRQIRDPYRVLLSELMLQQTQVTTVIPYYQKFLERWPSIEALAEADDQDVLKAWEGLGYYSRARNLLAAARQVVSELDSVIPSEEKQLLRLKGVGEYTAGAIRSIAYGLPAAAVDGNVVRVFSRLAAIPWSPQDPAQRRQVRQLVEQILPPDRAGDFNEALMDLGATICLPKSPKCAVCSMHALCTAAAEGTADQFPAKKEAKPKPVEKLQCLIVSKGRLVHVNLRPAQGLLGGLYEFDWGEPSIVDSGASQLDSVINLSQHRHVFSHKIWQISGCWLVLAADCPSPLIDRQGRWISVEELAKLPFPKALSPWRDRIVVDLSNDRYYDF